MYLSSIYPIFLLWNKNIKRRKVVNNDFSSFYVIGNVTANSCFLGIKLYII